MTRKTLTRPMTVALCRRCGEPYVAELSPRPLVWAPDGAEPVGGRLTVFDGSTHLVERHRPCAVDAPAEQAH